MNDTTAIPLNQIFYTEPKVHKEAKPSESFVTKGINLKLKERYDIKFTIGSQLFQNMVEFLTQVGYDAFFQFKKREVILTVIDTSNTHASVIRFDRDELLNYDIKGLETDDSEKLVFIDISPVVEKLSINENYPIDFYVDTLENHRYYAVCGKEYIWRQLNSIDTDGTNSIILKYKSFKDTLSRLTSNTNYQKVVINQFPLINLMKSLGQKTDKGKDITTICMLRLNRNELTWIIQDEVEGNNITLSSEDIMVYPIHEDNLEINLKFFNKFGKLKLTFATALYLYGKFPVIFETKLGGGKIVLMYLIAPYVDEKDK